MVEACLGEKPLANPDGRQVGEGIVLGKGVLVDVRELLRAVEHAHDGIFPATPGYVVDCACLVRGNGLVRVLEELVHRHAWHTFKHHQPLGRLRAWNLAEPHGEDIVERLVHFPFSRIIDIKAGPDVFRLKREVQLFHNPRQLAFEGLGHPLDSLGDFAEYLRLAQCAQVRIGAQHFDDAFARFVLALQFNGAEEGLRNRGRAQCVFYGNGFDCAVGARDDIRQLRFDGLLWNRRKFGAHVFDGEAEVRACENERISGAVMA